MFRKSRTPGRLRLAFTVMAAVFSVALTPGAMAQDVPCTGICVEAEHYIPPIGNAQMGTGPNAYDIVSLDVRDPATRSGGKNIWNYTFYDWLEWDVDIPTDGLYTITYRYASGWADNENFDVAFTFWTSGQHIVTPGAPVNSPTYQDPGMFTFPVQVPLRAGPNRFRAQVRPDLGVTGTGGAYNLDYIRFNRVGDYPNLVPMTGVVRVNVNGVATPVESALVSEDADPTKGSQYTEAAHLARTGADGRYTLYLPPGSRQVTAYLNGYEKKTLTVTAPGALDFTLAYNGRFEAELLDATNPGASDQKGVLAAYSTVLKDKDGLVVGAPSNLGFIGNTGVSQGKFASYRHVYAPSAGVYDVSMRYASAVSGQAATVGLEWSANGGASAILPFTDTTDFGLYQNSGKALLALKAGLNTIRWSNPNRYDFANMDYFDLVPATQPHGTLNIVVKDTTGAAVAGAKVTIRGDGASYSGTTDGAGILSLPVQPTGATPYTLTVSKAGATATDTATVTNGATTTRNFTLVITAIQVEGEDFVASGPDAPGAVLGVAVVPGASGGKVLEGLSGASDPGAGPTHYRWAEWVVNAPSDGLYKFALQFATVAPPSEFWLYVESTSRLMRTYGISPTGGPTEYAEYALSDFELVPLKAGPNRFRIIAGAGGLNLDYMYFNRAEPLPAMGVVSGIVRGNDGTGTAPLRNALVYLLGDTNDSNATFTDANGAYTLRAPTGTFPINVMVAGYATSPNTNVTISGSPATRDFVLTPNNPDATTPPTIRIRFPDPLTTYTAVHAVGPGAMSTTVQEIAYVAPSPETWVDLNVNAPRAGQYRIGLDYGSDWPPADQPGHITLSANGQTVTREFAKTGDYATHAYIADFATLPLVAGPNNVRIAFPDAAANIAYLDFLRTGDIVLPPSTDINGNGTTDILDAVLYARRLQGLDPGPTPDLTGDAVSNTEDVRRILRVAGGLF